MKIISGMIAGATLMAAFGWWTETCTDVTSQAACAGDGLAKAMIWTQTGFARTLNLDNPDHGYDDWQDLTFAAPISPGNDLPEPQSEFDPMQLTDVESAPDVIIDQGVRDGFAEEVNQYLSRPISELEFATPVFTDGTLSAPLFPIAPDTASDPDDVLDNLREAYSHLQPLIEE